LHAGFGKFRAIKARVAQNGVLQSRPFEVGAAQSGFSEICAMQPGLAEVGPVQQRLLQERTLHRCFGEVRPFQPRLAEIRAFEPRFGEVDTGGFGIRQIGTAQVAAAQIRFREGGDDRTPILGPFFAEIVVARDELVAARTRAVFGDAVLLAP
jgi:hypothetical protein